jgi:dimethylargininase
MPFSQAIVRPPSANFATGLSSAGAGAPDFDKALEQHARYVHALTGCGVTVTALAPDAAFPDATFVEDTAVLTARGAVLTRPGAASRCGETASMGVHLKTVYPDLHIIEAPGTVDGGDVCEADGHFLIGLSARTNEHGAQQLQRHLRAWGYAANTLDIRACAALLHLKSGIAYLGDGLWVLGEVPEGLLPAAGIEPREVIAASPAEAYAANCVRVNDSVLVAAGYPQLAAALVSRGCTVVPLEMSEFRKMDGGLSCLSLRY